MSLDNSIQPPQIACMTNGKGDLRRPAFIPEHELGRRWQETFGNSRLPSNPNVARSEIEAASGFPGDSAGPVFTEAKLIAYRDQMLGVDYAKPGSSDYSVVHQEIDGQPVTVLTAGDKLPSPMVVTHGGFPEPMVLTDDMRIIPDRPTPCEKCGEPMNEATKCHRASWQKNPGPRRK